MLLEIENLSVAFDTSEGTVQAVDVYEVLCAAMGLEPARNDGDGALAARIVRP